MHICHHYREILERLSVVQEKERQKKTSGENNELFDPVVTNSKLLKDVYWFQPLESTYRQNMEDFIITEWKTANFHKVKERGKKALLESEHRVRKAGRKARMLT